MDLGEMELTYSKRRKSIFRKAHQLALLSDAEVSILICSGNKFHEYTSPASTMKNIIDKYQTTVGVDLWSSHYEKMQEDLRRLKDVNNALRREIKQRKGVEVDDDDLNMEQLCSLEDDMIKSLRTIHDRKFRFLSNQTDVYKRKVRNLEDAQEFLRDELVTKYEHLHGLVENKGKYEIPYPLPYRNARDLRLEGSFERENSFAGSMVTMEGEDSP